MSLIYNEYFESLFFLFSTFKSKNRNIVSEQEFDLNSFLKNESDEMVNTVSQTVDYYKQLRERGKVQLKAFDQKYQKLTKKIAKIKKRYEKEQSQVADD